MFTPLDATHQQAMLTAAGNGSSSGIVAAILAAGIQIEHNNLAGWQVAGDATVAAQAQSIIDGYSGSATELDWHKAQALTALAAQYETILAAGRIYTVPGDPSGAHTYQIDEVPPFDPTTGRPTRRSSQDSITSAGAWAANVIKGTPGTAAWPSGFTWADASNVLVPMTAQQCYDFSQSVAAYVDAVVANYFALRAQISGAATVAAVQAVNQQSGWPANP